MGWQDAVTGVAKACRMLSRLIAGNSTAILHAQPELADLVCAESSPKRETLFAISTFRQTC